jgi:endonuclease YncB( thermonuclease family)
MKKLLILLLSLNLSTLYAGSITGKIVGVSDGDTVTLLTDENEQIKIRLAAIDCPEKKQDFGNKAKQFTSDFCFGKKVKVLTTGTDRNRRVIGFVYVKGRCLNKELLKAGLAWHYKKYNNDDEYAYLENEARANKIGLWSMKNPVAPWLFRKSMKQAK